MTIHEGVDVDKLDAFRDLLTENLDKGRLGLEARAVYEGQAGRSTVHIGKFSIDGDEIDPDTRHYTVPFGAWREIEELLGVEGPTDRMEPLEMALAATAACVVNSLTYNGARLGIATEGIEVAIRENVNPRVLFALPEPEEHVSCLGTVEIEVKVKGEISDEDLATLSGLAEYSPVYGLVAKANKVAHSVTRIGARHLVGNRNTRISSGLLAGSGWLAARPADAVRAKPRLGPSQWPQWYQARRCAAAPAQFASARP